MEYVDNFDDKLLKLSYSSKECPKLSRLLLAFGDSFILDVEDVGLHPFVGWLKNCFGDGI